MRKIYYLVLFCAAVFLAMCSKKEEGPVRVESVAINPSSVDVGVGFSAEVFTTITPGNAANQDVTWSSDNTDVAKVVPGVMIHVVSGEIIGVAEGTAVITARTVDGGLLATCAVTVKTPTVVGTWEAEVNGRRLILTFSENGDFTNEVPGVTIEEGYYTYRPEYDGLRVCPEIVDGERLKTTLDRPVECTVDLNVLTMLTRDFNSNGDPHGFLYPLKLYRVDNK